MRIHRLIVPVLLASGLVLGTAACSSPATPENESSAPVETPAGTPPEGIEPPDGAEAPQGAPAEPPTAPPADATVLQSATVALKDGSEAEVLVDFEGNVVYLLTEDSTEDPACNALDCLGFWPPVLTGAPAELKLGEGVTAPVGVWNHDNLDHLTLDDRPLYTFGGDNNPGIAGGHGLASNFGGGVWAAIGVDGTPLSTEGIAAP